MEKPEPKTSSELKGGKGKVSEGTAAFDAQYWQDAGLEARTEAIFELRRIYYEVLHPGTGSERMDRTVGGTRRRGESVSPNQPSAESPGTVSGS